jgi:tetratricopeptide (TPR) repeat protein
MTIHWQKNPNRKHGALAVLSTALLLAAASATAQQSSQHQRQAEFDASVCALGTGSTDLDIIACSRAINLGGHSTLTESTLHTARGNAYRISGRTQKALVDYRSALRANPLSAAAHFGRGQVLTEQSELDAAIQDFNHAIDLFPRFSAAWKHRGHAHFLNRDDMQARSDLDRAIALNNADSEAFALRAFVAFRNQRYSDAIADFRTAQSGLFNYLYTPLWIHLASILAGSVDQQALDTGLADLESPKIWPGVLFNNYLGKAEPTQVIQQARTAPGHYADQREAEAAFYLGMLALVKDDRESGHQYFNTVREKASANSVERTMLP